MLAMDRQARGLPPTSAAKLTKTEKETMHDLPRELLFEPPVAIDEEFWSIKTIVAKTGLSRTTIYECVKRGIFPRQRHLGPRRVAWLASEVRAWMASRPM
jgi:prophage regulatory protein